jgi:catechol 2,3-dioxygenase-like lactoylglutathione lyase family enzyme
MKLVSAVLVACLIACGVCCVAFAQSPAPGSVAEYLWQPSMNVFRRFSVDRAKMIEFYGAVLGLEPLPSIGLGNNNQMTRFRVGTSEVKLTTVVANRQYGNGPVQDLAGLRVLTFFFPDETTLTSRFTAAGLPAPAFRNAPGGRRVAMVADPDGQWVELVVIPGAPPETYSSLEIGITALDVEKSRAFYRSFVGLKELPPVHDDLLKTTKYPFRHGTTTINVWSFGRSVPVNTGSAGIQYVVSNVAAVDEKAKALGVKIDQPLASSFGSLRTVWLADPDGVTNYFAETAQSRAK